MRDTVYLIFDEDGIQKMAKTLRGVNQGPGLYVQKVALSVPDDVFQREIPEAEIELPADHATPIQADVRYEDDRICTTELVEVPEADVEAWEKKLRCPDCGAERVTGGEADIGVHYEPENGGTD